MPGIIVFLGPSLDRASAEKILAAEYRPPAKRGDLLRAVEDGAKTIILIDGVFHQDSAVAHREILAAVKKGVIVVGASSMGALRAAEMHTLGMTGIGRVYEMYRDGRLVSDDEVALVFDPVSGYALSEPLINIRCTLVQAEAAGIITPADRAALLAAARSVFYPQRTYPKIAAAAGNLLDPMTRERFLAFAASNPADQKREDAIAALEYVRELTGKGE
ncbi:TfuA-related McrA-glycine thioamidation protein [Methanoregula sp.]|uniref:TfuA-related McrA-glycine thioamidation protein n=1 Tax=Methanoregula sp. TaxID=2052170 RepID=UPI002CA5B1E4|nr:TfuA-related McrA-glycine thioamidation protein [Methanoregula sp.]HVP96990.1 TfuA-related McrA-glycine thioamidation protein [Methanoregula sp.]